MKGLLIPILLSAAIVASAARPVRNSFVDHRVTSVHGLVREVETDHEVAERFMRHFSMNKAEVVSFIEGLHLDRLHETAVYNVYSVPPDGHIKMHLEKLHAGEPVFADSNGVPVLLVKCGNPIVLRNQPLDVSAPPSAPVAPQLLTPPPADYETEVLPVTPTVPEFVNVPPDVPVVATPPAIYAAEIGHHDNLGGLLLLGIVGIGIGTIHGGHHHPTPPPTPEPASYAMFALGAGGFLLRRRSKRSQSK